MNFGAVILAAGYSSRMGNFKPLMQLGGQSLIERCAGLFRQAGIRTVLIVTGYRYEDVETEAKRFDLQCIHNPDYAQGMFSSVCTAACHLKGIDGFFLLPVDIPLVRPATISILCTAFNGRTALSPCFDGMRGHPPLIPGHLIPAILEHDGRDGLKSLLEKVGIKEIAVWDKGILMDADTHEDFTTLTHHLSRMDIGEQAEALALAALTMPERGLAHGRAAARVATVLGKELKRHGTKLNIDTLHNAALLHDVAKGQSQHEARGAEMLDSLGLGRLSAIVATHRDVPPPVLRQLTEKEVVCLADKLVRGSRRVSVRQRFEDKLALYSHDPKACRAIQGRLTHALALQALVEQTIGKDINDILGSEPNA